MSARRHGKGSKRPQHNPRHQGAGRKRRKPGAGFWGDPSKLPAARQDVRITDTPAAVVRSLGPPPLAGSEVIAEHYFAVVYDRAVALAGALAAAGGLIKPEELVEQRGE